MGVDVLVAAFAALRERPSTHSGNTHLVVAGEVTDEDRRQLAARTPDAMLLRVETLAIKHYTFDSVVQTYLRYG